MLKNICLLSMALAVTMASSNISYAALETGEREQTQPLPEANIVLSFPAAVYIKGTSVEVLDVDNVAVVPFTRPNQGENRGEVTLPLTSPLRPGQYVVRWRVISVEGRRTSGSYRLVVYP